MFVDDSVTIQKLVSKSSYGQIKYFLSNSQTNNDGFNRNPGMAKNLLTEILPLDTTSTYLLDVGIAHSMPNNKGSMVGILSRKDELKNKIVVMNVFCDSCTINGEEIKQFFVDYMKNDKILNAFRSAVTSELTIFDLSKLPSEFSYMKESGDLILFAKHQN